MPARKPGRRSGRPSPSSLSDLGQAVAKLNRTQFKSNTLAEMKDQQVATALGTLQDVVDPARSRRKRRGRLHDREAAAALRAEARGEFAAELLPALDGLEMALDSGRALLERRRRQEDEAAAAAGAQNAAPRLGRTGPACGSGWRGRCSGRGLPPGASGRPADRPPRLRMRDEMAAEVEAWLQGLEMVRTRFLALLATADIYPIEAEGQPFDPRLHLAMATESRADLPDGAVVAVLRKGYRQREPGAALRRGGGQSRGRPRRSAHRQPAGDADAAPPKIICGWTTRQKAVRL